MALSGAATLDFGSLNGVRANLEDIALSGVATGSVANKNVGVAKPVTVSGLSLAGLDAANYNLLLPTGLSATISAADLQITGAAVSNKTYDATRSATIAAFGTVTALGTDDVTLVTSAATAEFLDKNAAFTAKPVTVTGYSLAGDDALNYRLLDPVGVTASIARADLVLSGLTADAKTYDGTRVAPLGGSLAISPFGLDNVSISGIPSATFADKNAGSAKPVTVTGLSLTGIDAANYTFTIPALTADITRRQTTIGGITAQDRVYNGTTIAVLTGAGSLSNLISGDDLVFDLAGLSAAFADKRVGTDKPVTLSGHALSGDAAANYEQLLPFDLVADILAKQLSVIGADAVDRDYDRTVNVALTGGALAGVVTDDAVSLLTSAASGTVTTVDVGNNKPVTVTGYALAGDDAANYTLVQPTGIDVTIAPKTLTISGLRVPDRFFNGQTDATISGGTLNGVISGDAVSLVTGTGAFANPEVGLAKPVTLSGYALAGGDAANYRLPDSITVAGNILTPLRTITDVVPAEVLRASATTAVDERRAALTALNATKADTIVLDDFTLRVGQLAAGITPVPAVPAALRNLGPTATFAQTYLRAVEDAKAAADLATAAVQTYRATATYYKELGQQANATDRALRTESELRATYLAQISAADAELAKAEQNLAVIAAARLRIATLTEQIADADRLGRGSESAAFAAELAEARALVATEKTILAQRDAQAARVAEARDALAASETKVSELTDEKKRLAGEISKTVLNFNGQQAAAEKAKSDAAALLGKLETTRTQALADADAAAKIAADSLAALRAAPPVAAVLPSPAEIARMAAEKNPTELALEFPLNPTRKAELDQFITNTRALEKSALELNQRSNDLDSAVRSFRFDNEQLASNNDIFKATFDRTPAQIAAIDFSTFNIPDREILPDNDFTVRQLNTSAQSLTDRLSILGTLSEPAPFGVGLPTITPAKAPANLTPGAGRKVADLDVPTAFAPETERALKSELIRAGALLDFSATPQIAALPVATQLQLQSALRDYVARQQSGFDANGEAIKSIHDAGGEIATMLLVETLETYGLENIPGLEASVSKGISAFTQGLAKIGDARNPEEGFKLFGQAFADAGSAIGQSLSDTVTGDSDAARRAAAVAAEKAAEERRLNLFKVAGDLMKVESDRIAAVAARDRNLQQVKDFLILQGERDEAKVAYTQTSAAARVAASDLPQMVNDTYAAQITETLTARANDATSAHQAKISAAEADLTAFQNQSAVLAALPRVTGPVSPVVNR
ncbi:MAG: YDG domain-containing protein [Opitutaceae bacterium]|nr:YDG domain-containing protein [Opitutaceae bacterium]